MTFFPAYRLSPAPRRRPQSRQRHRGFAARTWCGRRRVNDDRCPARSFLDQPAKLIELHQRFRRALLAQQLVQDLLRCSACAEIARRADFELVDEQTFQPRLGVDRRARGAELTIIDRTGQDVIQLAEQGLDRHLAPRSRNDLCTPFIPIPPARLSPFPPPPNPLPPFDFSGGPF